MNKRFLVLPLLLPLVAGAEVYRSVDDAGNVTYSDLPAPGAERARLPGLSTYDAPSYKRAAPGDSEEAGSEVLPRYEVKILKPELNGNVRADGGVVEVKVDISPAPSAAAHTIKYRLDDESPRTANREVFYLRNLSRGPHTLAVWVADRNGKAASAEKSSSFFLSRGADLFHPQGAPAVGIGVNQAPRAPMAPRAPRQDVPRQYGPPVAIPQGN